MLFHPENLLLVLKENFQVQLLQKLLVPFQKNLRPISLVPRSVALAQVSWVQVLETALPEVQNSLVHLEVSVQISLVSASRFQVPLRQVKLRLHLHLVETP